MECVNIQWWLSNYHLAVLDEDTGSFAVVGKTFKGLTDEEFQQMTERLLSIKTGETEWGVTVRPEIVVEVAYNEIQRSPHYESGLALRFARIGRIRSDKSLPSPACPHSAATITTSSLSAGFSLNNLDSLLL